MQRLRSTGEPLKRPFETAEDTAYIILIIVMSAAENRIPNKRVNDNVW